LRDRLHTANGNNGKILVSLAERHFPDKMVGNTSGTQGTTPTPTPPTTSATQAPMATK